MIRRAGARAISGGTKGALFGLAGGFMLGVVGNVFSTGLLPTEKVITWKDRQGKTKKFTNLETLESFDIYRDLGALSNARECDAEAFNDACRHIQSVIYLYNRFQEKRDAGVMDHRRLTNYAIMATKSMNALLVSCRAKSYPESSKVQESMMNIHLTFEEAINSVRHTSKDALPDLSRSSSVT